MPDPFKYQIYNKDGKSALVDGELFDKNVKGFTEKYKDATIRMIDPSGNSRNVPLGMYEEAKRRGGRAWFAKDDPSIATNATPAQEQSEQTSLQEPLSQPTPTLRTQTRQEVTEPSDSPVAAKPVGTDSAGVQRTDTAQHMASALQTPAVQPSLSVSQREFVGLRHSDKPFGTVPGRNAIAEAQKRVDVRKIIRENAEKGFEGFYQKNVAGGFQSEKSAAEERSRSKTIEPTLQSVYSPFQNWSVNTRNAVVEARETDPEKVANTVLNNIDEKALSDYVLRRMGIDPSMSQEEQTEVSQGDSARIKDATAEMRDKVLSELQERMYNEYKEAKAPKSVLEYILSSAMKNNLSTRLLTAIINRAAGSRGVLQQLEGQALQEFGEKQSAFARGAAAAGSIMMDAPWFKGVGMIGNAARAGITNLFAGGGKMVMNAIGNRSLGTIADVASKRWASMNPFVNVAAGSIGSGITFGLYDTAGEAINEFQNGELSLNGLASAFGHGFFTGSAVGMLGGTISAATRNASKAKKLVADVGGFAGETALFTGLEGYEQMKEKHIGVADVDWASIAGKNAAMLGVLKLQSIPQIRERYKSTGDILTKDDKEALKAQGIDPEKWFGLDMLSKLSEERNYSLQRDGQQAKDAGLDNGAFHEFLANENIPINTRRRVSYLMCGVATPEPRAYDMESGQDENGFFINTYTDNGKLIDRKTFKNQSDFNSAFEDVSGRVQINTIGALRAMSRVKAPFFNESLLSVAEEAGIELTEISEAVRRVRDGKATQTDRKIVERVNELMEQKANANGDDVENRAANAVLNSTGIDITKALAKKNSQRTPLEKQAVSEYVQRLQEELGLNGENTAENAQSNEENASNGAENAENFTDTGTGTEENVQNPAESTPESADNVQNPADNVQNPAENVQNQPESTVDQTPGASSDPELTLRERAKAEYLEGNREGVRDTALRYRLSKDNLAAAGYTGDYSDLDEIASDPTTPPELKQAAIEYMDAHDAIGGYYDAIDEQVAQNVEKYKASMEPLVDQNTGMITFGTDTTTGKRIYVTSSKGRTGMYWVVDENGENKTLKYIREIKDMTVRNPEEVYAEFQQQADQQAKAELDAITSASMNVGDKVSLSLDDPENVGSIVAVNPDGSLLVKDNLGKTVTATREQLADIQDKIGMREILQKEHLRQEREQRQTSVEETLRDAGIVPGKPITLAQEEEGGTFSPYQAVVDGFENGMVKMHLHDEGPMYFFQMEPEELISQFSKNRELEEAGRMQAEEARMAEEKAKAEAEAAEEARREAELQEELQKIAKNRLVKTEDGKYDFEKSKPEDVAAYIREEIGLRNAGKMLEKTMAPIIKEIQAFDDAIENGDLTLSEAADAKVRRDWAQDRLDFWNEVKEGVDSLIKNEKVTDLTKEGKAPRERKYKPLEDARDRFSDIPEAVDALSDLSPRNLEEVASEMLWSGEVKLLQNDDTSAGHTIKGYKSHTGFSQEEATSMLRYSATRENGGIGIEHFGELVLDRANALGVQYDRSDANAGLDAVVNLLSGIGRDNPIANYIANQRIAEAKAIADAYYRQREDDCWNRYGMGYYEYEAMQEAIWDYADKVKATIDEAEEFFFSQDADRMAEEKRSTELLNSDYFNTFAEEFKLAQDAYFKDLENEESNDNDQSRAASGIGNSGEVQQGQRPDGLPGERMEGEEMQSSPESNVVGNVNVPESSEVSGENAGELSGESEINALEEKRSFQAKIKEWLSSENLDWADGKDLSEIAAKFGNELEPISVLPEVLRSIIPSLDTNYLYSGKAYLIDHAANHHPELDVSEYDKIQDILDNYDDIKDITGSDGNLKMAFIKKIDKGYAVVAELSKENDKILLHKTFFYKDAAGKRIPFKNKPSLLNKLSVDGSTTISPTSDVAGRHRNISALDNSSESKDTTLSSENQISNEKSENKPVQQDVAKSGRARKSFKSLLNGDKIKPQNEVGPVQEKFDKEKASFVNTPGENAYAKALQESNNVREAVAKIVAPMAEYADGYKDWAGRQYKKNNTAIEVGGKYDDLDATTTSIGSVNERRRNARMAEFRRSAEERMEWVDTLLKRCGIPAEERSNYLPDGFKSFDELIAPSEEKKLSAEDTDKLRKLFEQGPAIQKQIEKERDEVMKHALMELTDEQLQKTIDELSEPAETFEEWLESESKRVEEYLNGNDASMFVLERWAKQAGQEPTYREISLKRAKDELARRKAKVDSNGSSKNLQLGTINVQASTYVLGDKKDNEGNKFYEKNGSIDLWDVSKLLEGKREVAPVRLTDRNIGHILDEHKKEFSNDPKKVVDFLDDVFSKATVIRRARGGAMFVVVVNDRTNKAAIIKLMPSEHGDYYNVESAGFYRKDKWKENEEIISELSEPTQSDATTNDSKPQNPQRSGEDLFNAESLSESKDTALSSENQISSEKSSDTEFPENSFEAQNEEKIDELSGRIGDLDAEIEQLQEKMESDGDELSRFTTEQAIISKTARRNNLQSELEGLLQANEISRQEMKVPEKLEDRPVESVISNKEKIQDFGEKIGMARKDTAKSGFKRSSSDGVPSWKKKYKIHNADAKTMEGVDKWSFSSWMNSQDVDVTGGPDSTKPFIAYTGEEKKTALSRWMKYTPVTDEYGKVLVFNSEEEFEATIPVYEAAQQKFKVRKGADGQYKIVRPASNGKLVEYATFDTEEQAKAYLASPEGATSLLNHKRENYELPALENLTRNNMPDYRDGKDATPEMFMSDFGFRGGEFGNWVNAEERQQFLNLAYDAFMDLADVLGVSPKAISLGGELSIAFGARGGSVKAGGGSAAAHYEPGRAVINLTKMHGAGSVAHEWAHALDNYFGLQGRGVRRDREKIDSNDVFITTSYARHELRPEVRDAIADIVRTMTRKTVTRKVKADIDDEEMAKLNKSFDYAVRQGEKELSGKRTSRKYNRKTKEYEYTDHTLTDEQKAKAMELISKLPDDPTFKFTYDWSKNGHRAEGDVAKELYSLISDVLPNEKRSFGPLHNVFLYADKLKKKKDRMKDAAASKDETVVANTDYVNNSSWFDRERATNYWTKPEELFARAMESWIADKMEEQGKSSDYLTYKKGGIYEVMFKHNPYPTGEERIAINESFQKLFDTIEEKVEDGKILLHEDSPSYEKGRKIALDAEKGVSLQDPTGAYTTRNGRNVVYKQLNLFDNEGEATEEAKARQDEASDTGTQKTEGAQDSEKAQEMPSLQNGGAGASVSGAGSGDIQREAISLGSPLRNLNPGEFCNVERQYTENGHYSFTSRTNRIESVEDVAYIFKSLEDKAVENSFVALVKDGKPYVIHLGIGGINEATVDLRLVVPAVHDINPDEIYLVHNHPSGRLVASRPDAKLQDKLVNLFGYNKVKPAIIIDTNSGKYAVFDELGNTDIYDKEGSIPENEIPVKVFSFDKQLYYNDWKPGKSRKIGSDEIASFVTTQRTGQRGKLSALILSNSLDLTGNIHLPYSDIVGNEKEIAGEINYMVAKMGGTGAIIYGNRDLDIRRVGTISQYISNAGFKLYDVIAIEEQNASYRSANDESFLEPEPNYGIDKDSMYEQAVRDGNLDKARKMLLQAAAENGYSDNTDYQGSVAFNGTAPGSNGYFDTREERIEAFENGDFEGTQSFGDYTEAGLDGWDLGWQLSNPAPASHGIPSTLESIRNLSGVARGQGKTIKMYRAVPADVKEESFRNGDWVTPSRRYAEYHITLQDWDGGRIIEQEVPVDDIWWDGNDINEWGYDDGKQYAYRNTENNRKLLDITYDENGDLIPLSERFNQDNPDTLHEDEPEYGRHLAGVHNIYADKLRKAMKLGGLANPSTAVIDTNKNDFNSYGEISLVMPSSMVDAKTGRNAGTWTADAWTPVFPQIVKKIPDGGYDLLNKDMEVLDMEGSRDIWSRTRNDLSNYLERDNSPYGLSFWYLTEKGLNPEVVRFDSGVPEEDKELYSKLTANDTKRAYELSKDEIRQLLGIYAKSRFNTIKDKPGTADEILSLYQGLREEWVEGLKDPNIKSFIKRHLRDSIEGVDTYGVPYGILSDFTYAMGNAIRKDGKIDANATLGRAENKVKKAYDAEFLNWLDGKMQKYGVQEKFYAGMDKNGNAIYKPNTLEAISRHMKSQGRNGSLDWSTTGNLIATVASRVRSLKQIRNVSGNLTATEQEHKEFKEKWGDILYDIADECYRISSDPNAGFARLSEALKEKNPALYLKKEYGVDLSTEAKENLSMFVDEVQNHFPTGYFETKFERPVMLEEFAAAVVPGNVADDIRSGLQKAGLKVIEYEPGNEESRKAAMQEAFAEPEVRFSESAPMAEGNGTVRSSSTSPDDVRKELDSLSSAFHTPVIYHPTLDDVPAGWRKKKGVFNTETGEIHLIGPNLKDVKDAHVTFLHEVTAHNGLRRMLGDKEFNGLCDRVWAGAMDKESQERYFINAFARNSRRTIDEIQREAADEYMANLSESEVKPSFWKRIKAWIKNLFHKLGINLRMTDDDILYMLWKSRNRLMEGDDLETTIRKTAADSRKQRAMRSGHRTVTYDTNGTQKSMDIYAEPSDVKNLVPVKVNEHNLTREQQKEVYTSIGEVINKNTLEKVVFYNSAFGKNHREGGLFEKIIPQIKDIFETSVLAYTESEQLSGSVRKDGTTHKEHRSVLLYKNYLNKVEIGGKDYYVRFTVQSSKNQDGLHSTFVTNVDVYENPTKIASGKASNGQLRLDLDRIVDAKLQKYFELANIDARKVQELYRTSEELDRTIPGWNDGSVREDGRDNTQITGTVSTYKKIGKWMQDNGMKGHTILDASSGLGLGTKALREMGFDVEDVEPFPSESREAPTYKSYDDITKKYDMVISNAVLNVIPDDWRNNVLHSMADKVKPGGKLFINVRDAGEIKGVKNKVELDSPHELLITNPDGSPRHYQRFWTKQELIDYVKGELGDGWKVEAATVKNIGVNNGRPVICTKLTGNGGPEERYRSDEPIINEQAIEALQMLYPEKTREQILDEHSELLAEYALTPAEELSSLIEKFGSDERRIFDRAADYLTQANPVSELSGDEFQKEEGNRLTDRVAKLFEEQGGKAKSPFGTVILDRKSAKNSINHGMSRDKAAAFASVKDVIEKGIEILPLRNWRVHGKAEKTGMVAAPITINGERRICVVEVISNKKDKRLYTHEAFVLDDSSLPSAKRIPGSGIPSYSGEAHGSVAKVLKNFLLGEFGKRKPVFIDYKSFNERFSTGRPIKKKNESQKDYLDRLREWEDTINRVVDENPDIKSMEQINDEIAALTLEKMKATGDTSAIDERIEELRKQLKEHGDNLYQEDKDRVEYIKNDEESLSDEEKAEKFTDNQELNIEKDVDAYTRRVFQEQMKENLEDTSDLGIRRTIKESIIERRSILEVSNYDDAVFFKDIERRTTEEQRAALPFILEGYPLDELPDDLKDRLERFKTELPSKREVIALLRMLAHDAAEAVLVEGNMKNEFDRLEASLSDTVDSETSALEHGAISDREWFHNQRQGATFSLDSLNPQTPEGTVIKNKYRIIYTEHPEKLPDTTGLLTDAVSKYYNSNLTDLALIDYRDLKNMLMHLKPDTGGVEVTPELKQVALEIRQWFDDVYEMLKGAGFFDAENGSVHLDNYVTHIWKFDTPSSEMMSKYEERLRTSSPYVKHRLINSLREGIEMGLEPKFDDIIKIMSQYGRYANEAVVNRGLINNLLGFSINKMPVLMEKTKAISGYKEMPGATLEKYKVHPSAYRMLQAVFLPSETSDDVNLRGISGMFRVASAFMKKMVLNASFFHHIALTESIIANTNPVYAMNILLNKIILETAKTKKLPAYQDESVTRDAVAHLVKLGVTDDYNVNYINSTFEAFAKGLEFVDMKAIDTLDKWIGDHPTAKRVPKALINEIFQPVIDFVRGVDVAQQGMDTLLWDMLHDAYKLWTYKYMADEIRGRKLSDKKQEERLLNSAGQWINDSFGGQHWEVIGMSPQFVRFLSKYLLSADWTVSAMFRQSFSMAGFGNLYNVAHPLGVVSDAFHAFANGDSQFDQMRGINRWKQFCEEWKDWVQNAYLTEEAKFRLKKSYRNTLMGWITTFGFYGFVGALARFVDVQTQEKIAEERRAAGDKDYLSPYEILYPHGMKWYDYTFPGNTYGNKTYLFAGRYPDGTERYAREGKQYREIVEMFYGRDGFEVPGAFIDKMVGKLNPMWQLIIETGGGAMNSKFVNREIRDAKPGVERTMAILNNMVEGFVPWSLVGEWNPLNHFMPNVKGMRPYRARTLMEEGLINKDLKLLEDVRRACIMNGLDTETIFKAAKQNVYLEYRKSLMDGVNDLQDAIKQFDTEPDLGRKDRLGKYIDKQLGAELHGQLGQTEFEHMINEALEGRGNSKDDDDAYLKYQTSDDRAEDVRFKKAMATLKPIYNEWNDLSGQDKQEYYDYHRREIDSYKSFRNARSGVNQLKKSLKEGRRDPEEIMENIREIRRKALRNAASLK